MSLKDLKITAADYAGKDMEGFVPTGKYEGSATLHLKQHDKIIKDLVAPRFNALIDALHPVGEIYLSADNVNPAEKFGGTWVAWGSGRVPVGVDAGQTEFETAEKTGGAKTHTLTVAEMPAHKHKSNTGSTVDHQNLQYTMVTGTHWASNTDVNGILNAGGDAPHNNLQPYITCYMWKRTA